jgi:hypothetical protein
MGNDLTKTNISETFLQVAEETGSQTRLMKFVKGVYKIGADEVPAGREYVAHVLGTVRGAVKFVDKAKVDQIIGKVADGFKIPDISKLDDPDKWQVQYYLPLEDVETGELVIFVSGSHGGIGAIGELCGIYGRQHRNGRPIIKTGVRTYNHKIYGEVATPEFTLTGWDPNIVAAPPANEPPSSALPLGDLNDEIPF